MHFYNVENFINAFSLGMQCVFVREFPLQKVHFVGELSHLSLTQRVLRMSPHQNAYLKGSKHDFALPYERLLT